MEPNATLIQHQLDAYNNKDIDAWLSTYASDACQFNLHGDCIAKGYSQIKQRMLLCFAKADSPALLLSRIVMGHIVVDHEIVTRNDPERKTDIELLCVCEIEQGRRQKVAFAAHT